MTVTDQTQDSDDIGKRLKENLCPRCETTLTWVSKTDVTAKRKCKQCGCRFMTASTKKVNHGV
jgi:transcription elongation factor Elf1